MNAAPPAASTDLTIQNVRGLHARAAAKFCETANQFSAKITVTKDQFSVNGDSLMDLLMLGAGLGSTINVHAEGSDASDAIDALSALVESKFDEVD